MSDAKKFIQDNAVDVIKKFGGIRPMASKLGVAVTTVQGWKKRETIPDARIDEVIQAAYKNEIVLSASNENGEEARPNIEDTIAQIKAKIEAPREENDDTPDEETIGQLQDENTFVEDDTFIIVKENNDEESLSDSEKTSELNENAKKTDDIPDVDVPPSFVIEPIETTEDTPPEIKKEETVTTDDIIATNAAQNNAPATKSQASIIISLLIGLAVLGLAALFWPVKEDVQATKERLAEVETELIELKEEQNTFMSALSDYVPEDMKAQIESFKEQTDQLGEQVGEIAQQTKQIATDVIGADNTAAIQARLSDIENQISGLVSSSQIQSILSRFSTMNDTEEGQEKMDRATGQLHGIIGSLDGRLDLLDDALVIARENSTALGETFEGVEDEDLKAGALLLGLTQFRSALNRNRTPFEEDLALLYNMVGAENNELRQSLDRLAPQAKSGVLTPIGLANEFRTLAGDIAVNSLKGEDVTVSDQAKKSLSKVLQIKKGGENLLVDESEEKVQKVQTQLDGGDLRGAMSTLSSFSGNAALTAKPFMEQLSSAIAAQEVKGAINSMLATAKGEITGVKPLNLKNLKPSMTETLTPDQIVTDRQSGFKMLPQDTTKPKGFKNLKIEMQ